jgi:hypothetical protein
MNANIADATESSRPPVFLNEPAGLFGCGVSGRFGHRGLEFTPTTTPDLTIAIHQCLIDGENMQNFISQKAQQALEAMCEEAPLPERLRIAKSYFEQATRYLDTAPEEVRKYVKAFISSDVEQDIRRSSNNLQSAIESVFEEWGREDVTLGKSRDSEPWSN